MARNLRTGRAGSALLLTLGIALAGATPARAITSIKITDKVNAQTTLATLNQTVVIPTGAFVGSLKWSRHAKLLAPLFLPARVDVNGKLSLPPATGTVGLVGIGLANATFTILQTKPVTGTVNTLSWWMRATSIFNIHVDSVTPQGTDVNLVGPSCETSEPVTLSFAGKVAPFGGTVAGTYAIPPLKNCGALTAVLNAVMAGPGNTFTARMAP